MRRPAGSGSRSLAPWTSWSTATSDNALVALDHRVVRWTWADTLRPGAVPALVRAAL